MPRSSGIPTIILMAMLGTCPLFAAGFDHGVTLAHSTSRTVEKFGVVPLSFEPNVGQTGSGVDFVSHGSRYVSFLSKDGILLRLRTEGRTQSKLALRRGTHASQRDILVSMQLKGANLAAHAMGLKPFGGLSNYLIGNDPSRWHTSVPRYSKVRYSDIYPGIDVTYYGRDGQLEYDFRVRPNGNPKQIVLRIGGGKVMVDRQGNLRIHVRNGAVRFRKPLCYQVIDGHKHLVRARYTLSGKQEVRIELGPYDRGRSVTIDPVLSYSTYLGGSNADVANAIATDLNLGGYVFITGSSLSVDFPVTSSMQMTNHGGEDVVVTKLNSAGTGLVFSTYVGGSADDFGRGITVDDFGNVYVVGNTTSPDFPVTSGAFQTTFAGSSALGFGDGFVFRLNPQGNAFLYSTYIGGSGDDRLTGVAIDQYDNVYATVSTTSTDFPTTAGALQRKCTNIMCGGVIKLKAKGASLAYSTYLAGSGPGEDQTFGIALDSQVHAYVTGMTGSPNFPVTPGAFQTRCGTDGDCNGSSDGYVAELNATGTGLVYSTFLGGSSVDVGIGIILDPTNAAYVYGGTDSSDFPVTSGAAQTLFGGSSPGCNPSSLTCGDNFITKVNSTGSALLYSTYLGGSGDEDYSQLENIGIDKSLNAWVSGQTASTNFPTVGAIQPSFGGGSRDAFVTELNPAGNAFVFSTYLGGSGTDYSTGIAVAVDFDRVQAQSNATYVTGVTTSPNFPIVTGAFQPICGTDSSCNGGIPDTFVAKIVPAADLSVTNSVPTTVASGATLNYTIVVSNQGPDEATSVTMQDNIPAGATFSSVTASTGTCNAPAQGNTGSVKCTISSLESGASATINLTVNVTAASGSTIKDAASVTSMTLDQKKANNIATAKTGVT